MDFEAPTVFKDEAFGPTDFVFETTAKKKIRPLVAAKHPTVGL